MEWPRWGGEEGKAGLNELRDGVAHMQPKMGLFWQAEVPVELRPTMESLQLPETAVTTL